MGLRTFRCCRWGRGLRQSSAHVDQELLVLVLHQQEGYLQRFHGLCLRATDIHTRGQHGISSALARVSEREGSDLGAANQVHEHPGNSL